MIKKILMGRRNNILGINERNIKFVYPSENRKYFKIADEKSTAKQLFLKAGVPHPKTLWECREFKDIVNLRKSYADYENTVIKPNKGRGGHGILVLDKSNHLGVHDIDQNLMTHKHIRKHLADIIMGIYSFGNSDKAIFENRLFPDSFLKNIYARGLADFRFIIYKKNPVMAMLRIPTEHSHGKANLHQGGIGVGIDMEKGVTTHAIYKGGYIDRHPDSKKPLAGLPVPCMREMIGHCIRVSELVALQYIGFDFTLDAKEGPMLLEINARPGLEIQKANKKGLMEVLS